MIVTQVVRPTVSGRIPCRLYRSSKNTHTLRSVPVKLGLLDSVTSVRIYMNMFFQSQTMVLSQILLVTLLSAAITHSRSISSVPDALVSRYLDCVIVNT